MSELLRVAILVAVLCASSAPAVAAAATPVVDRATASRWPWSPPRGVAAFVVFLAALMGVPVAAAASVVVTGLKHERNARQAALQHDEVDYASAHHFD